MSATERRKLERDADRLLRAGRPRYAAGGINGADGFAARYATKRGNQPAPETRQRTPLPIELTEAERAHGESWLARALAAMNVTDSPEWIEWRRKFEKRLAAAKRGRPKQAVRP